MLISIKAGWSKLYNYFNKSDQAIDYITAIVLNHSQKWAFLMMRI